MVRFLFLFLFISFVPVSALAEGSQVFIPPGSNFENEALKIIEQNRLANMRNERATIPTQIFLELVQPDYLEDGQFGILMKTKDIAAGCYELSPIGYDATFIDNNYLDIKVNAYKTILKETQNVTYDCDQTYKTATGLIVLNTDDLKNRNIREIRFSNGGVRDTYFIELTEGSVTLRPDTTISFKTAYSGSQPSLTHYFGTKGLIALQVPMAYDDDQVESAVRDMAARYAFNPINDPTTINQSLKKNIFYFSDNNGRAGGMLNEDGYAILGEIGVARHYVGENGLEERSIPLKVFVTRHDIIL